MDGDLATRRSCLFLQGMATGFFARLGRALTKRGHAVHRVNFNAGDRLFWRLPGAVDYRGDLGGWPEFLAQILTERRVTDIILFGDCRPLHRAAIKLAALRGIPVHVFEEGYLRPNWVTLEQGGVNGHSALPADPAWFREEARHLPVWDGGQPARGSFFRRAVEDVVYNVATTLFAWRYPRYRTHLPWHPFIEYAGWLKRFASAPAAKRRLKRGLAALLGSGRPYFFFPLQLDCDSQIREHWRFGRLAPAIEQVIVSFARNAPGESLLALKEHPLDSRIADWRGLAQRLAARLGVAQRIIYLEGGPLEILLQGSRGVVTINSTVGFLALSYGLPVIALGNAIYDMPELTFQGGLDDFWRNGEPPDPASFDAVRRVVASRTQVNGGFFSEEGLALAVAGAVARIEDAALRRPLMAYARAPGDFVDAFAIRQVEAPGS